MGGMCAVSLFVIIIVIVPFADGPSGSGLGLLQARETGGWVLLCNCHLSISWLPDLETICEQMNPEETDNNYRLWCAHGKQQGLQEDLGPKAVLARTVTHYTRDYMHRCSKQ
eukprot:3197498-Amphidinium_carterae.1